MTIANLSTGDTITESWVDSVSGLLNEPTTAAFQVASTFIIPNAANTPIDWTAGIRNTAWRDTDKSKLVVPIDGVYQVTANVAFDAVTAGKRVIAQITRNGAAVSVNEKVSGVNAQISTVGVVSCVAGNYLGVAVYHNHGSARNVNNLTNVSIVWLGPAS